MSDKCCKTSFIISNIKRTWHDSSKNHKRINILTLMNNSKHMLTKTLPFNFNHDAVFFLN